MNEEEEEEDDHHQQSIYVYLNDPYRLYMIGIILYGRGNEVKKKRTETNSSDKGQLSNHKNDSLNEKEKMGLVH